MATTVFMAYKALNVRLSYELVKMLPSGDSLNIQYDEFKKQFGEDGHVMVVGVKDDSLFQYNHFVKWYNLVEDIKKIDGIQEVVSITRLVNLVKNDSLKKFQFKNILSTCPKSQAEVDSIKNIVYNLPIYNGLLFNKETNVYLMMITVKKDKIVDQSRVVMVDEICNKSNNYAKETNSEVHFSGLPYIRTATTQMVKVELIMFIIISIIISILIMILFFKSFYVVLSSTLVVIISIIWTLGTLNLFGYKITILTGVIPSLLVIIAIENCIYILNKYHWEYKLHGGKIKALTSVINRIGLATFMTNATTAVGFATFILTNNTILEEFGVIASINVMIEYLISITLVPILFTYLPAPTEKQVKHLDNKKVNWIIEFIIKLITKKRNIIYICAISALAVFIYGATLVKTSGKVVDDLKHDDPIYVDLKFFEQHFKGVMPFEITIDSKKKNGIMRMSTIQKMDDLQKELAKFKEFSRPLSIVELVKFARQAFYNGNAEDYEIPSEMEKNFILSYLPQKVSDNNLLKSFLDSNKQITRISVQMADIGTKEMRAIENKLRPKIDSIFDKDKFTVNITGNSVVYTKGTDFLAQNLIESVLFGIIVISFILALLFSSARMVIIAMLCNLIPLVSTAAIMGFGNIPVKPSTLIVFSVALGISIDNAVLFLTKYRYNIKKCKLDVNTSIINAMKEAGISMIYTSIVLVLGFSIYIISDFGGTQALGMLISITLMIALMFNILVLPSLLFTFAKYFNRKSIQTPILDTTDDDEVECSSNLNK